LSKPIIGSTIHHTAEDPIDSYSVGGVKGKEGVFLIPKAFAEERAALICEGFYLQVMRTQMDTAWGTIGFDVGRGLRLRAA